MIFVYFVNKLAESRDVIVLRCHLTVFAEVIPMEQSKNPFAGKF